MSAKIYAPFDQPTIQALNECQTAVWVHPFTCGGDKRDKEHLDYATSHGGLHEGQLIATPDGWICPVCNYTQDWAWPEMVETGRSRPVLTKVNNQT